MLFTRDSLGPGGAKLWIYGAVAMSLFSAAVTVIAAVNGWLGIGRSALLDAAITLGLAYGIWRRSLTCAWLALLYYVLNRIYAYFDLRMVPSSRAITFLLFYSMAIVSIGLYPAQRLPNGRAVSSGSTPEGTESGPKAV